MGEALRLLIDYQIKSNYVPSPLVAVVNVLLLKEKICLPSHTTVSSCQLFSYILHVIKKLHKKRAKSVVYPKFENKQCRAGNSVRFRKNIINTMFWLLFALDVGFFFDSRTLLGFAIFDCRRVPTFPHLPFYLIIKFHSWLRKTPRIFTNKNELARLRSTWDAVAKIVEWEQQQLGSSRRRKTSHFVSWMFLKCYFLSVGNPVPVRTFRIEKGGKKMYIF